MDTVAQLLASPEFSRVVTITRGQRYRDSLTSDRPTFFLTVEDGTWTGRVCWADYLPMDADLIDARTLAGENVTILYTPGAFPID